MQRKRTYRRDPTLSEGLLGILTYYGGGYRILRGYVNGGVPVKRSAERFVIQQKSVSDGSVRTTLYRLKDKGLVQKSDSVWRITSAGHDVVKSRSCNTESALPPHSTRTARTSAGAERVIVMFDIPESKKRTRNWVRTELGYLGFEMLQKSVWIGPAPLPREFSDALHTMETIEYFRFFTVSNTAT